MLCYVGFFVKNLTELWFEKEEKKKKEEETSGLMTSELSTWETD